MVTLLFVLMVLIPLWVMANLVAWSLTLGSHGKPFNWRIFLGAFVYTKWLDKRYEK